MAGFALIAVELIVGAISFVGFIATYVFFGQLIWLQTRVWMLAKKGFAQIRHVREDKVEKYYYLRVRDEHYDFNQGVYISQKDAFTKSPAVLNRFDFNLLKEKQKGHIKDINGNVIQMTPEELEIIKFLEGIKGSKIMDISTLSWGIPTITYFGNDPNPHNYADRKKVYDAKNIAALIKRILMTKEWKLVRMVLILCAISIFLWLVYAFLSYNANHQAVVNWNTCQTLLNESQQRWMDLANQTAMRAAEVANQSSVVKIG